MKKAAKKPAIAEGIKWGLFAGTATISAFLLPAFIIHFTGFINLETVKGPFIDLPNWIKAIKETLIIILLFSALYHSLYRFATIAKDLNLNKKTIKKIKITSNILLIFGTIAILSFIGMLIFFTYFAKDIPIYQL